MYEKMFKLTRNNCVKAGCGVRPSGTLRGRWVLEEVVQLGLKTPKK